MATVELPPANTAVPSKDCSKQCMGTCCLPGSVLPLYVLPSGSAGAEGVRPAWSFGDLSSCSSTGSALDDAHSFLGESSGSESGSEDASGGSRRSFIDSLITSLWDERSEEGLFRYDVASCETKVIPGDMGLVAQFNEGRHMKKRPTEFSMDSVLQPFDSTKFNFTKVGQREALFALQETPVPTDGAVQIDGAVYQEDAVVASSSEGPNIVAINVSPIEYGHVLLIPGIHSHLPQRMDALSLELALRLAAEVDNPSFRLGYNSLGAFATVNHLHFQGYYLNRPFAVERACVSACGMGPGGVSVSELEGYPVRGLVFGAGECHRGLAEAVGAACEVLQQQNMPFNLFISCCGSRVFLFPQCYSLRQTKGEIEADLLDTQVNPAVFEISGHMVMKRRQDFDSITEELARRLLAAVSLSELEFKVVKNACLKAAGSNSADGQVA